ncbi:hypothetical protein TSUD_242340 [Trifolium subterraneum]|uniref:RCC1-like domain-containing protein n=1 Tax=Trifolium subterraneum TaxID=3900 RepID=A0A2Z6PEN4_TRISU|nr:hypothetical protein TSUD_242340 [Trifolium subterraneum]
MWRSRELLKSGAVVVRRRWMSTVMSFGDGSHGALGLPTTTVGIGVDSYEPTPIPSLPSDILTIHAGHYHSIATTSQGHLWAWGRNNEAQLGRGLSSRETWNEPKRVEGLENVKVCAAFASGVVSSAVGEDGSVWVWGKSKRGQLGLGKDVIEAIVPSRLQALSRENIAKVSFGWGHALALTVDGKLFGWGYYADGRIGNMGNDRLESSPLDSAAAGFSNNTRLTSSDLEVAEKKVLRGMEEESNMPIIWEPRLVEELRNVQVVDIACGLDHSLVLCRDGVLLSCGSNVYDQLGRTREDLGFFPVDINLTPVSVAAGSSQLGRSGPTNLPALIDTLDGENPVSVSAGRAHSIALTSKGEMWVWGSGKNGRLGLSSSVDEVEPFYLDSLEGFQILQAVSGFDHNLVLVAE